MEMGIDLYSSGGGALLACLAAGVDGPCEVCTTTVVLNASFVRLL